MLRSEILKINNYQRFFYKNPETRFKQFSFTVYEIWIVLQILTCLSTAAGCKSDRFRCAGKFASSEVDLRNFPYFFCSGMTRVEGGSLEKERERE